MTTSRKLKLAIELELPEGLTDAKVKTLIQQAIDEAITEGRIESQPFGGAVAKVLFTKVAKGDPLIAQMTQANEDLEKRCLALQGKLEEVTDAFIALRNSPNQGVTNNTIQTINALIHGINQITYEIPPSSFSKTEYYKAGMREALAKINETIRTVGLQLVADIPRATDAELFIYWITEAANRPMRLMKALSGVKTPEQHREAIEALRAEDIAGFADQGKALLMLQGGLQ